MNTTPSLNPTTTAPVAANAVTAPATKPRPITGGWIEDLIAMAPPRQPALVQGLLYNGINILGGLPKVAKTIFASQISVSMATGTSLFGDPSFAVPKGGVLYIEYEDPLFDNVYRINNLLKGLELPPKSIFVDCEWPTLDRGGDISIGNFLKTNPDTKLVVVDVFEKLKGFGQGRSYSAMYKQITSLHNIAKQFEVGLLLLHHTRKDKMEDWQAAFIGSLGLVGSADTLMFIERPGDGNHGTLKVKGRKGPDRALMMHFNESRVRWDFLKEKGRHKLSPERKAILEGLLFGPRKLGELAKDTGLRSNAIWNLLNALIDQDLVYKMHRCHYALTKLGEAEANI